MLNISFPPGSAFLSFSVVPAFATGVFSGRDVINEKLFVWSRKLNAPCRATKKEEKKTTPLPDVLNWINQIVKRCSLETFMKRTLPLVTH